MLREILCALVLGIVCLFSPTSGSTRWLTQSAPSKKEMEKDTGTHTQRCVDKGLKYYDCPTMKEMYSKKGKGIEKFCEDYHTICCLTCQNNGGGGATTADQTEDTTAQCTDTGFLGRSCSTMQRWYSSFQTFCEKSAKYCCNTCENNVQVCEDVGFMGYSCDKLEQKVYGGKSTLCRHYAQYCCLKCKQ